MSNLAILSSLAVIPTTQFLVKDLAPSANNLIDCNKFLIKTGLKTFNCYKYKIVSIGMINVKVDKLTSNCPLEPATEIVILLPIT